MTTFGPAHNDGRPSGTSVQLKTKGPVFAPGTGVPVLMSIRNASKVAVQVPFQAER